MKIKLPRQISIAQVKSLEYCEHESLTIKSQRLKELISQWRIKLRQPGSTIYSALLIVFR